MIVEAFKTPTQLVVTMEQTVCNHVPWDLQTNSVISSRLVSPFSSTLIRGHPFLYSIANTPGMDGSSVFTGQGQNHHHIIQHWSKPEMVASLSSDIQSGLIHIIILQINQYNPQNPNEGSHPIKMSCLHSLECHGLISSITKTCWHLCSCRLIYLVPGTGLCGL